MAVKIRLKRLGTKKRPFYRFVVADVRAPRDGRFIEELGTYNPLTEPKSIRIDAAKVQDWIKKGAKPTTTVDRLLKENGVYDYDGGEDSIISTEPAPKKEVVVEPTAEEVVEAAEEQVDPEVEAEAEEGEDAQVEA
ncbi:MAG: 30S ribosomal protein S16 [Tissierellia bacterium]|nr:30S ribosomal protein S16 [Tissierellia bacterium]